MTDPLSKMIRRADAVSESASVLVSRAIREIRGEIANLSGELNLAGNADDRDRAYAMIRRRMNRLGRNLNRLLSAQNQEAAKGAAKAASDMTGLEIKYSAQRAKAICELVTPAQGENLAAVFTERMGANMIRTLREATVSALRQQAIAGGSVKDLSRDMSDRWSEALKGLAPVFTDAGGHAWNTAAYFQMNVRTNTMRVYNDCLVDDVARETGSDLMRISKGGDPNCPLCFPWEGCIISVSGKTRGFPTYDDARKAGCFHPNCTHTLEYVDESADADEIALHKDHPVTGDPADADAQDERRYEIDQARKMRDEGMTAQEARVAVDRDNLAASIRHGLVRSDAEKIVSQMTDAQVTRLCQNGNPPAFTPVKRIAGGTRKEPKYEPERWNHGRRGGVVHIKRDADLAHIIELLEQDAIKRSTLRATGMTESDKWNARAKQSEIESEKAIAQYQQDEANENSKRFGFPAIQGRHTFEDDVRMTNPNFSKGGGFANNCQRCIIAFEARCRGLDVVAKAAPLNADGTYNTIADRISGYNYMRVFNGFQFLKKSNSEIVDYIRSNPHGSRFVMFIHWKHVNGDRIRRHVVNVINVNGDPVIYDSQSNKVYSGKSIVSFFERTEPGEGSIGRVDDKTINTVQMEMALNPRRVRKYP